jgi:transcriptional regulator with XRE-family HTH domain
MRLEIIYELLKKKGVSFKHLSQVVGKTDTGLRKNINKNAIDAKELKTIAETFDVSIYYFYNDYKEDVKAPTKMSIEDRLQRLEDSMKL